MWNHQINLKTPVISNMAYVLILLFRRHFGAFHKSVLRRHFGAFHKSVFLGATLVRFTSSCLGHRRFLMFFGSLPSFGHISGASEVWCHVLHRRQVRHIEKTCYPCVFFISLNGRDKQKNILEATWYTCFAYWPIVCVNVAQKSRLAVVKMPVEVRHKLHEICPGLAEVCCSRVLCIR